MSKVKEHFNQIAAKYDYFKAKNWYYYDSIKVNLAKIIPDASQKSVLDIGCGTGEILNYLHPKTGLGVDLSEEMILIAKEKYPQYSFFAASIDNYLTDQKFDYLILIDIIEHLENLLGSIKNISNLAHEKTKVIIFMANPLWEPLLMLAEKLCLKMPEGPHYRITNKELISFFKQNGFTLVSTYTRLLLPKKLFFSDFINKCFFVVPILKKLGLINIIIIEK
ncbi:MAG: class I SAM-dependent methyltransferase [Candidatus Margulisiibacteriota bacterium]|jgi:2-polyprenyl-3-methyl-5-hydroxy-6-metoxy-1,4-benzoquinol methylase